MREFFGELLMEQRRERTLGQGVMLGTVHGSKGQEYEHVLLLDGAWKSRARESWEEVRRLYYVGMTRARQTLTLLASGRDGAPWIADLHGDAVCRSRANMRTDEPAPAPLRYRLLDQSEIWLSYAGCALEHERVAAAIDRLSTGDPLRLVEVRERVFLLDRDGIRVGALSQPASLRWREDLPRIQRACVAAVLIRRREDEGPGFQDGLRRSSWGVVIPEITYLDPVGAP